MPAIIKVENLKKSFGPIEAVRGINFHVEQGQLFAFLGPNGAGKSTTIDMLCTLLTPSNGTVVIDDHVLGKENELIRKNIGVVFQDSVLDPLLTVRENLAIRAKFYDLSKSQVTSSIQMAVETVDATEFLDRPYGKLSGGQRRRVDIARALINTPKILFLDEPTTGLDPKTKESVWQTIFDLQKKEGLTVFLTTHYMEEAATADYIVILNHGEIAEQGTPYTLKEKHSSDTIQINPKNKNELLNLVNNMNLTFEEKNDIVTIRIKNTMDSIPIITKAQPYLESFEVIHGSMDDVFLKITKGELRNV